MAGGDDLEENYVLDSEYSSSGDESIDSDSDRVITPELTPENSSPANSDSSEDGGDAQQSAKKVKLNWREVSSNSAGTQKDQLEIIRLARVAFEKFFPASTLPLDIESLSEDKFLDISEYANGETKNAQELFLSLRKCGFLECVTGRDSHGLRTVVVTSSATRGMYLVKELKELDKSLSPLPLFFHGGGRKREQAQTHESVISGGKASVAVCLPSRLRAVTDAGILDLQKVDLVVFDLKQNEKKLNVLSMKDTMADSLAIIGRCLSSDNGHTKLCLI